MAKGYILIRAQKALRLHLILPSYENFSSQANPALRLGFHLEVSTNDRFPDPRALWESPILSCLAHHGTRQGRVAHRIDLSTRRRTANPIPASPSPRTTGTFRVYRPKKKACRAFDFVGQSLRDRPRLLWMVLATCAKSLYIYTPKRGGMPTETLCPTPPPIPPRNLPPPRPPSPFPLQKPCCLLPSGRYAFQQLMLPFGHRLQLCLHALVHVHISLGDVNVYSVFARHRTQTGYEISCHDKTRPRLYRR